MRSWQRWILDRLLQGTVPIDGDVGRRPRAAHTTDRSPCHDASPAPAPSRPGNQESAWIPRAILYGPPL